MGGFMFDTNDKGEEAYIPGSKPIILFPRAVEMIAEKDHLPDIPHTLILDKSKADSFAKGIVIVQASWLVLQCITRWIAHLPVTKLELNTLAHAVCALVVYALWWDKPLDVRDPTLLSGEWARRFCAVMYSFRYDKQVFWMADRRIRENRQPAKLTIPECFQDHNLIQRYVDWSKDTVRVAKLVEGIVESRPIAKNVQKDLNTETCIILQPYEIILPFGVGLSSWNPKIKETLKVTPTDITRWQILLQAYYGLGFELEELTAEKKSKYCEVVKTYRLKSTGYEQGMVATVPETLMGDDSEYHSTGIAFFIFMTCAFFYGGIHAISWNGSFSSSTEHLLWQISCVSVTGCGILLLGFYRIALDTDLIDDSIGEWGLVITGILVITFYSICRTYLVVEAFLSLRKMQLQAYETPAWTQFLPHL
jgi:hypothetical protein